jgi:anti-sigma regulatory factor (Ser/Thr protein kinase)
MCAQLGSLEMANRAVWRLRSHPRGLTTNTFGSCFEICSIENDKFSIAAPAPRLNLPQTHRKSTTRGASPFVYHYNIVDSKNIDKDVSEWSQRYFPNSFVMARMQIRLAADERTVARLKGFVECFCKQRDLQRTVSNVVMLSVDEIVSNIILHGYRRQAGEISIALHFDGQAIAVVIEDAGKPFDPTKAEARATGGMLASRREGGLGLLLVKALMDDVKYQRAGAINRLTLIKRI